MGIPKLGVLARAASLAILLGWMGTAAAQFEVIGTVTGSMEGETRTWYALGFEADSGPDGTAWLRGMLAGPMTYNSLDIQAHAEERYMVAGTLAITGTTFSGLDACPCSFEETEVLYFPTSSMFEGVYQSIESEVVLESVEVRGDGIVSVTGSFTAVLGFVENVMSGAEPDPDKTIEITGEFTIDRMLYEAP